MGLHSVQLCERKTWEYKLFSLERFGSCQAAQVLPFARWQSDGKKKTSEFRSWFHNIKIDKGSYKYSNNKMWNTLPENDFASNLR